MDSAKRLRQAGRNSKVRAKNSPRVAGPAPAPVPAPVPVPVERRNDAVFSTTLPSPAAESPPVPDFLALLQDPCFVAGLRASGHFPPEFFNPENLRELALTLRIMPNVASLPACAFQPPPMLPPSAPSILVSPPLASVPAAAPPAPAAMPLAQPSVLLPGAHVPPSKAAVVPPLADSRSCDDPTGLPEYSLWGPPAPRRPAPALAGIPAVAPPSSERWANTLVREDSGEMRFDSDQDDPLARQAVHFALDRDEEDDMQNGDGGAPVALGWRNDTRDAALATSFFAYQSTLAAPLVFDALVEPEPELPAPWAAVAVPQRKTEPRARVPSPRAPSPRPQVPSPGAPRDLIAQCHEFIQADLVFPVDSPSIASVDSDDALPAPAPAPAPGVERGADEASRGEVADESDEDHLDGANDDQGSVDDGAAADDDDDDDDDADADDDDDDDDDDDESDGSADALADEASSVTVSEFDAEASVADDGSAAEDDPRIDADARKDEHSAADNKPAPAQATVPVLALSEAARTLPLCYAFWLGCVLLLSSTATGAAVVALLAALVCTPLARTTSRQSRAALAVVALGAIVVLLAPASFADSRPSTALSAAALLMLALVPASQTPLAAAGFVGQSLLMVLHAPLAVQSCAFLAPAVLGASLSRS